MKLGPDILRIDDYKNTAFKYPENELQVHISYHSLLGKITKDDVQSLKKDIENLSDLFEYFGRISHYYFQCISGNF
ncbi:hypothetical protein COV82_06760 [Candidatus Peregrinibacteria bacterium CG11_big_fil_rev_8_21_14_0_20_46_8]|nr:MAG: hypothetical protein COV82_06760 [Candidatus Peregrinibacteria bacterium CG11_big_fil_rev_8_21_14_0_20_46_8]